jgi:hypothetical protein
MRILILSNSLVVTELFKLALDNDIKSEYKQNIDDANKNSYEIIFIDDTLINFEKQIENIESNLDYKELVIIANGDNEFSNKTLKKPFLPKDIRKIIEDINNELESKNEPANVLDLDEIERIKSIIELNEYEEKINKKKFADTLKSKESIKAKNKEAKKLIKELCKMSKKEQKELFGSAKVTIKIDYKD